jgi:hypothetical protein
MTVTDQRIADAALDYGNPANRESGTRTPATDQRRDPPRPGLRHAAHDTGILEAQWSVNGFGRHSTIIGTCARGRGRGRPRCPATGSDGPINQPATRPGLTPVGRAERLAA